MISGANIIRKIKIRTISEEKSKNMRIIYRCEYEEKEDCEASRPDSPLGVTCYKYQIKAEINRIDVMISILLILMPFGHRFKHVQLFFWMTLDYLIVAIFPIPSSINIAIVRRGICWKYIDNFHTSNTKHKVNKSDRFNHDLRDGRIKEYIFFMLPTHIKKCQRKAQIPWCFF